MLGQFPIAPNGWVWSRVKAWLLVTVCIFAAGLPTPSLTGPDGCVVNGNEAVCSGDQSAGVIEGFDFDAPPVQIVTVDSTTPIAPVPGNAGVDFSGDDAGLIDLTVRAPGGISITGSIAAGINAILGEIQNGVGSFFDGDVTVDSIADITAIGQIVQGISAATRNGIVVITSQGDILVNDSDSAGTGILGRVRGIGDVTVDSTGAITVTNVTGIAGFTEQGNVSITSAGPILTSGDSAEAIQGFSDQGNVRIETTGQLNTSGPASHGVSVFAEDGSATVINQGDITSDGDGALPLFITSVGDIDITSTGNLTATGPNSIGLAAVQNPGSPTGGRVSVQSIGDIIASGADSTGLFAQMTGASIATLSSTGNISGTVSGIAVAPGNSFTAIDLAGGTISGDEGIAVDIRANTGSENAFVSIDIADDATVETITSGIAIQSVAGTTRVSNAGTITGSVGLISDGSNQFINETGALFEPFSQAIFGPNGLLLNDGVISPYGTDVLGITDVTGTYAQDVNGVYLADISDVGSDSLVVDGSVFLDGALDINATTPESSFTVNDLYFILDGTQGINGGFSAVTDNLPNLELVPLISLDRTQLALRVTTDGAVLAPGCTSVGAAITCSGNQSGGITNRGLDATVAAAGLSELTVRDLTAQIVPVSGLSAIDIQASSASGFTLDIDTGTNGIQTFGGDQEGIEVRNDRGGVTVISAGPIATFGTNGDGIVATSSADGDISIVTSSDIITSRNANGVLGATRNGNVSITSSGSIETRSDLSRGLLGLVTGRGNITIENSGNIDALDDALTELIFAEVRGGGDIEIINSGNLTGGDQLIEAFIGNNNTSDGTPGGNIIIRSDGVLGPQPGDRVGGIDAEIEGDGSIEMTLGGAITTNTFVGGTVANARINGSGSIKIDSTATIVNEDGSGITGVAGIQFSGNSGDVEITSTGDVTARTGAISAVGVERAVISSEGDVETSSISNVINASAGGSGSIVSVTSVGNITQNGSASSGSGSGISAATGSFFDGAEASEAMITSTGNINVTGDSNFGDAVASPAAGIRLINSGPTNGSITSIGNIQTNGLNSPGIAMHFREFNDDGFGDITITSVGTIAVSGEFSDAVRVRNGVGGTTTVNLSGGDVTGGGDRSAGVSFLDVAGATGILNFSGGTLSAGSGLAVSGGAGDETVNNSGTIVGDVRLGAGDNAFNNLASGFFASGQTVDLGGGVLTNDGILAPGNSIGTTAINGDLVLTASSTLDIEIDQVAGQPVSDVITVTGMTTLGGTLAVSAIDAMEMFVSGTTFDILESAGGITGSFAQLVDTLPDLDIAFNVLPGESIGQITLVPIGSTSSTAETTSSTSDKAVHPNAVQAGGLVARNFNNLMIARDNPSASRFAFEGTAEKAASTHFSSQGSGPLAGAHRYFWAQGFGSYQDVDSTGGVTGYDANSYGLALGYEHVWNHNGGVTTLGAALGFGDTDVSSGLSSAGIETYSFGVYGSVARGPWTFSAALSYGEQDYDTTRIIPLTGGSNAVAIGAADGSVFAASAKVAYDAAPALGLDTQNQMRVAPFFRFDHIRAKRDAFTESGAGVLDLAVNADSFTQNMVSLGVETSAVLQRSNETVIRPYLNIRWEHVLDGANTTSNSFVAILPTANFTSAGAAVDQNRLGISAGLRIDTSETTSLDLRYDGSFSSSFEEHRASVQYTIRF